MKHLLIIGFIIGLLILFGANSVHGLWIARSAPELLEQSQTIFVGNITGIKAVQVERSTTYGTEESGIPKTIVENYTLILEDYDVKIEEFLKNPQSFDAIKVRQPTISGAPTRLSVIGGFDAGDRVLFYLDKIDGENMYSPESFKIPKECDTHALVFLPKPFPSPYEIKQGNLVNPEEFIPGINIHFSYPVGYNTLESVDHDFKVKISKIGKISKEPEFEKTFQIHKKTCEWTNVVQWDFVPESGEYLIQISNSYDQNTTTSILTTIPIKDPDKIQLINGKPFFVSEKYDTKQGTNETVNFHGIKFAYPSYPEIPDPGGFASTTVIFEDGTRKSISVGFAPEPIPVLAERKGVSAGMMRDYDGLHFLVGTDLSKMSPLKQFRSGILADEIVCKEGLELVIKSEHRHHPMCVKPSTKSKMIQMGLALPIRISGPTGEILR